ncbi:hypothetical protein MANES_08G117900v8 [Manihot esculenta]|uniref:Uncharacterized protein n=1 Tax=Manihot esculenta TaxID=3983 RepID=A0ACB7HCT9_MANES|nr:hypothetical protein MANES_08G117900v8 [Manihot esculenta]
MALFPSLAFVHAFMILLLLPSSYCFPSIRAENRSATLPDSDTDLLEFSLNWKFLEAEFFLHGALGHGLDMFAPNLTFGGPQPIGARMANLDPFSRDIILQFAWHHVGHLRAINRIVKGFPRPLLDLSAESFAEVIDLAFERPLSPPFDPCASGLNFLIASYLIRYVGLTGFVGINPKLQASHSKKIVAGILAVEAGQDAVI